MWTWHDSWIVDDGLVWELACELNETDNIKVAW